MGRLKEICVREAKEVNPSIKLWICGLHGGDSASIEFCHSIGLNDVLCSPRRAPVARPAAAQAVLSDGKGSSRDK